MSRLRQLAEKQETRMDQELIDVKERVNIHGKTVRMSVRRSVCLSVCLSSVCRSGLWALAILACLSYKFTTSYNSECHAVRHLILALKNKLINKEANNDF